MTGSSVAAAAHRRAAREKVPRRTTVRPGMPARTSKKLTWSPRILDFARRAGSWKKRHGKDLSCAGAQAGRTGLAEKFHRPVGWTDLRSSSGQFRKQTEGDQR